MKKYHYSKVIKMQDVIECNPQSAIYYGCKKIREGNPFSSDLLVDDSLSNPCYLSYKQVLKNGKPVAKAYKKVYRLYYQELEIDDNGRYIYD